MACSVAHNVIPFEVNTTCPNRERDGNNKIYANQRQGAWFGLLRIIYIDSVHIKGIRSTGVDAQTAAVPTRLNFLLHEMTLMKVERGMY